MNSTSKVHGLFYFAPSAATLSARMEYAEAANPTSWFIWMESNLGERMVDSGTEGRTSLSDFQNQKEEKKEHSVHAYTWH